jgi:hypothetical protein
MVGIGRNNPNGSPSGDRAILLDLLTGRCLRRRQGSVCGRHAARRARRRPALAWFSVPLPACWLGADPAMLDHPAIPSGVG